MSLIHDITIWPSTLSKTCGINCHYKSKKTYSNRYDIFLSQFFWKKNDFTDKHCNCQLYFLSCKWKYYFESCENMSVDVYIHAYFGWQKVFLLRPWITATNCFTLKLIIFSGTPALLCFSLFLASNINFVEPFDRENLE